MTANIFLFRPSLLVSVIFILVCCSSKSIPNDKTLIALLNSQKQVFEKYVRLVNSTPQLSRISISKIEGEYYVFPSKMEESVIVKDFTDKMNVELIKVLSFKDKCCIDPKEIGFFVYSDGFAKGIVYSFDPEKLSVVSDLDLYGTDEDPRINSGGKPKIVYRAVGGNWFLFAK